MKKLRLKILNIDEVPDCVQDSFAGVDIQVMDTVPAVLDFDATKQLGVATLEKTEDAIYATVETWPEEIVGLTPAIGGLVLEKTEDGKLKKVCVNVLSFNKGRNADSRIQPVSEADVVE